MNAFLSDIWHDLREKRLWPVALALLIGLVAVPVLLAKPAPETSSAPVTPPATAADTGKDLTPVIELADLTQIEQGSKLQEFNAKNPFKPKIKTVKLSDTTQTALNQIASDTGGGGTPATTDGGGTTGGGTPTTPTTPGTRHVSRYTYVIDVTFVSNGRKRVIKGLDRLSMLPSETNPALIFLGVSSAGSNAVFLVDSTLDATGEGNCAPSAKQCATLSLGAGSEHMFTDQKGNSYSLRVDQIRKVKVGTAAATAAKRAKQAHASVAATADEATAPIRRFVPPILADLVTVANNVTAGSSTARPGR
jgi:hypothetical protein